MYVASALAYASPLTQDKNRASLHDVRTELGKRSNLSPLLLEAPLGRTLDQGRVASGNGAARPPKRFVWVSWAGRVQALDEAERNSSGDEDGDDLWARTVEGRSSSEELLPLTAIRNVHNSFDCSTTGKPTRLFRTKCASLDSV